jgi:hypothetical protein
MRNRPGRIFYSLDFKGLEQDFIVEYCQDNLQNNEHIEHICKIALMFSQFNFDMLKALVEEMNRYGETPQQAMKMLNAKPEFSGEAKYKVTLQPKGLDIDEKNVEQNEWQGNPLQSRVSLDYRDYTGEVDPDGDREWNWENCVFNNTDLKQIDSTNGKFVFINDNGDRVVLARVKDKSFEYYNAF